MRIRTRKTGVLSAVGLVLCAALLPVGGCAQEGAPVDVGGDDGPRLGAARLSVQAAMPTSAFAITRVTVTAQSGHEIELVRDADDHFTGTLILPEGPNQIVGNAFIEDQLVGSSAPVSIEIQAGATTQANLRILDATEAADVPHSPIVVSLTYPLSAVANQPAQLAITAVDPDDDALTVAWSSDCADATFSAPAALVTDFIKPGAGTCAVSVSVSDGALSTSETFSITVFEEDQDVGAVNIDGEFIARPSIVLNMMYPGGGCWVDLYSPDGTCEQPVTPLTRVDLQVQTTWGNSPSGTVEVTDDCGGVFLALLPGSFFQWQPPAVQTVCSITAIATNGDGLSSLVSAALLVRPQ